MATRRRPKGWLTLMADMLMKVCDLCRHDSAQEFVITYPDGQLRLDLCTEHQQPLFDLRDQAPDALFSSKGARKRRDRVVVDPGAI